MAREASAAHGRGAPFRRALRLAYDAVMAITGPQKAAIWLVADGAFAALAFALAAWTLPGVPLDAAVLAMAAAMGLGVSRTSGFAMMRLHGYGRRRRNRHLSQGYVLGALLALLAMAVGVPMPAALGVGVLAGPLGIALAVALRLAGKSALERLYRRIDERRRTAIWGAGLAGIALLEMLRQRRSIDVVGFIDDDPALTGETVRDLAVHGPGGLEALARRGRVDDVHLAMPNLDPVRRAQILLRLRELGVEALELDQNAHLLPTKVMHQHLRPVSAESLLGRDAKDGDMHQPVAAYAGRTVLVTGAGGSIGSTLCQRILASRPAKLVLLDVAEHDLYQIDRQMRTLAGTFEGETGVATRIVPVLGSVCDPRKMRAVLADEGVDVVLHAAAYKHVPLVEMNPLAGLSNNVLGTQVVAEAAYVAGVERFVLVSSDKAVNPQGVMGASKRLSEIVVQDLSARALREGRGTIFSMVRFGNVLGSSGSVVPLFHEQIAAGGPVTVTDPKMKRYFMSITEAASLVLAAGGIARGGEVFVLDMGTPQRVQDLAESMIAQAGLKVFDARTGEGDIRIDITGLRPGEKLEEELFYEPGRVRATAQPGVMVDDAAWPAPHETARAMSALRGALDAGDAGMACRVVSETLDRVVRPLGVTPAAMPARRPAASVATLPRASGAAAAGRTPVPLAAGAAPVPSSAQKT